MLFECRGSDMGIREGMIEFIAKNSGCGFSFFNGGVLDMINGESGVSYRVQYVMKVGDRV